MEWILCIILGAPELTVEVQQDNRGANPRRARFNASLMDTMHVEKNAEWKDQPPTIVIFITAHDVLEGGKPIYHVERTVRELGGKRFEDDAEIIYVNASIRDDTPLGQLMQDFQCKDPEKMHSEVLAERARYFKSNEHGVMTMCEIMEEFAKKYAKKYAEGEREKGVAIGRAAGVAEKTMRTILNQLQRHADYEIIASDNETTIDEVIRIAKENNLAY